MFTLFRLALRNLASYRVRFGLTVAAIALSISLVVAVTSGYRSIRDSAQKMLEQYMGTMDAQLTMRNQPRGGIEQAVVNQLRGDPDVERVDGRLEIESGLLDPNGKAIVGRAVQLIGIDRPSDTRVDSLEMIAGHWFKSSDGGEAVIDQVARDRLGVKIGDIFFLPTPDGKLPLRVVGFVHKPGILAQAIQTAYVPLHTLQKFSLPNQPGQLSRVLIDLKPGVDPDQFFGRWKPKIDALNPLLKLQLASENRRQMDRNLQGLAVLSYLGSSVALIASAFIVFSALSMGVMERQRVMATLRAIGASRTQLGGMVLAEAAMLAGTGIVIGVPLGVLWIKLLAAMYPMLFSAGGVVSGTGVLIAVGGDLLVAAVASVLPALSAMRSSPVDAMLPMASASRPRGLWIAAAAGVLCMAIDPLLIYLPTPRSVQFYGHFSIGLGGVMIGAFLIAPLLIRGLETILGPFVSWLLRVRPELLRQQLSGAPWRAAGSAAALMIGLATLIVTQVQGQSSIGAWKIPDKFPDIFIFSASGLNAEQVEKMRTVPGVVGKDVMPIAIASPQFGKGIFAIIGMALLPDATDRKSVV